MAWTTGRILLQLCSHRFQRQSFVATTPDGSNAQKLGPIGTLQSENGTKLNMDGFPSASKGSYMECLFCKWLQDHSSIHGTWHRFFKDLVEDKAPPSAKSDSESGVCEPADTIPPQPDMGLVTPANGSVIKLPEKMSQQQTPKEPEKPAKEDQEARKRRRISKLALFHKFANFRRRSLFTKRSDLSLYRAQRIPGRKGRPKGNTMLFKSYYEDKLNKEKAKQSKRKQDGRKDISKENELPEKPKEKPLIIHLGEGFYDPNETPKTLTYQSPADPSSDLDIAPINMALPDPINSQKVEEVELSKMPADGKSFTDLPSALLNHPEKSSKISENKAIESISSAERTAEPTSENLTERLQSPLGDVSNNKPQTDAPSQPSL